MDSTYTGAGDVQELGGKGHNLLLLQRKGYPVPPFVIIPVSFFAAKTEADVIGGLQRMLPQIISFFDAKGLVYAVRSSAVAEDSDAFSFAGQFMTRLNIAADELVSSIVQVWRSAQSPTLDAYKAYAGITEIPIAVIVQQMVPATTAGVAFGLDPLTGRQVQVVNAVRGLGEALVSGETTADTYKVDKENIIEQKITAGKPVLAPSQVKEVADTVVKLASFYGKPQDIEFAFVGEDFFLLQSRPVTVKPLQQKITWDNSNIIESYPGLTLPLTFSFIEKMYEAVYIQLSKVLGITSRKINVNSTAYANMLGLLNGRVYYNLNSWYKVLSLLPGYNLNAEFMERMMGVKDKPDIDIQQKAKGFSDYIEVLRAFGYIFRNLSTIRKQKDIFIRDFEEIYQRFDSKDYGQSPVSEILGDYHECEQMMVKKWKAPLVNDFFAMIYFGVLQKMCAKYFPQHPDIHNQLIASSDDIITTEPVRQLPRLVTLLTANPQMRESLLHENPLTTWKKLQEPAYVKELAAINTYLAKWGERSIAELKLETITYTQEPQRLIAILKSYAAGDYATSSQSAPPDTRKEAERTVKKALAGKPLTRFIFRHVLNNARYLVSNRENLRYYRTRGFGMVRRMMMTIGNKLQASGTVDAARDIFYLRLTEIDAIAKQTFTVAEVKTIIQQRKTDYELYNTLPLPERVETYGKQDKILLPISNEFRSAHESVLQGIPCSAGVVQARVKLMHYADELDSLNKQIMATYATDPGWVVLFPTVSGILTERGSLLSHAAIVSREMGIPCIVGIEGLIDILKDGDEIIMDGSTGSVKIMGSNNTIV